MHFIEYPAMQSSSTLCYFSSFYFHTRSCSSFSFFLLKHPTPKRRPTHNPSRPPNPPNHKFRPHTLRNPPFSQLHQYRSKPLIPIPPQPHSVRSTHRRKRRQHHVSQTNERRRFRLAHKCERRGQQADDEGQAEVEGCEGGVACAEKEEGEGLEDLELLGFRVEGGFEDVGESWGEEGGEEGEDVEGGGERLWEVVLVWLE
jgi:hypothetical protein